MDVPLGDALDLGGSAFFMLTMLCSVDYGRAVLGDDVKNGNILIQVDWWEASSNDDFHGHINLLGAPIIYELALLMAGL